MSTDENATDAYAGGQPFFICGCPRSGTTWIHNILLDVGRFRGIPGDDLHGTPGRTFFVTDENRYVHHLLLEIGISRTGFRRWTMRQTLRGLFYLVYLRFGSNGEMLLKSPYYCFFLDTLREIWPDSKIIYVKRSFDAVARSMLKHPHISKLIASDFDGFFDMKRGLRNFELDQIPPEFARSVESDYERLKPYDRALFKCLCFSSAFARRVAAAPRDSIFILEFESFGKSSKMREDFFRFLNLTGPQANGMASSFKLSSPSEEALPPHTPAFRQAVLQLNDELWGAVPTKHTAVDWGCQA
jgi:hypothetical protein